MNADGRIKQKLARRLALRNSDRPGETGNFACVRGQLDWDWRANIKRRPATLPRLASSIEE
jgi:hypothetical protein